VTFSVTMLMLTGLGNWVTAETVLATFTTAAFLESAFGLCVGCKVFAGLMRVGIITEEVCERCNNIWEASATTAGGA
jgi:hypothetical protein